MKVVIIGGVAGGASAAARLRRLDENATIIMFERGEFISFANCGLPYYIGGVISDRTDLALQTPDSFRARYNIDVRNLTEVIAIDKEAKQVRARQVATGQEYTESYDQLILATGAAPLKPEISGIESSKVFTLRTIPDADQIKDYIAKTASKSVIVVGGGYIGVEMAENLKIAGLKVTIVELTDHLIGSLDWDMAALVHQYLRNQGVELVLSNGVKGITDVGDQLKVSLEQGSLEADLLIMAVGVRPDTDLAKQAGLQLNLRGSIIVNEYLQTSDPHIYAVGDGIEVENFVTKAKAFIPLAGPANRQGRIAADNIMGRNTKYTGTQGSAILKIFELTVATTGVTEDTAKAYGMAYDKVVLFPNSHASYYPGATTLAIKAIFEKYRGKLLGVQVVGFEGVDKRCDIFATAIRTGMIGSDLNQLELCYAPPFSAAKDPVNMVGFVIENTVNGLVRNFHWHDIETLPSDGSVIRLDVRQQAEVEQGRIEGFIHIALDDLRAKLDQLDKSKPIYVHCHSGLRSYLACRILSGQGFECYNLSGGYRLYQLLARERSAMANSCLNCK